MEEIIERLNNEGGPYIVRDFHRGHGLIAHHPFKKGEVITNYGGQLTTKPISGDYVAYLGNGVYTDASEEFHWRNKGRWINEYDKERSQVNVILGRCVRAARDIREGEYLYADYGPDYQRDYADPEPKKYYLGVWRGWCDSCAWREAAKGHRKFHDTQAFRYFTMHIRGDQKASGMDVMCNECNLKFQNADYEFIPFYKR